MRYFDTAPQYGWGIPTPDGPVLAHQDRSSYVLSTKVGRCSLCAARGPARIGKWFEVPSRREVFDYSYDGVRRSVEFSLGAHGAGNFDILFAHDLECFPKAPRRRATTYRPVHQWRL